MITKIKPFWRRRRTLGRSKRAGATAVEFAMVAPAFLIVIVLCAEFARMSLLRNLAHNACYETCRFIMAEGATIEDGREFAQSVLDRVGQVDAEILINGADGSQDDDGNVVGELGFETEDVRCEISLRLSENTVILPSDFFGDATIRTQMSMRTERFQGFFDSQTAAAE